MCSDWLSLQWTAAGGRGLQQGSAPSPVGRGFSCQSGGVIDPPPNMVADSVKDRVLRATSVRVPVLVTHTHGTTHTHTHTVSPLSLFVSLTVDGVWSGWSSWGECSSSCIPQGRTSIRTRHRSCSNPAPSSSPPGRDCHGDSRQVENCNHLPHCPGTPVCGSEQLRPAPP